MLADWIRRLVILCSSVRARAPTGGFPFWFGRAQDAKAARVTTYLPDENIIPYSESLVQHPVDHPYDELVELIQTKHWAGDRIGVEMDAHYYTARCHSTLANALSNA